MVIQLLLSALFTLSAIAKILALPGSLAHRQRLGVPLWLWRATGFAQAIGVLGLLLGLVKPLMTILAGGWLCCVMIGAFIAHWRVRDHWRHYVTVISLLALTLFLMGGQ
ncbi:MAG: DoxX family protein [Caldilineaceae bacterium]